MNTLTNRLLLCIFLTLNCTSNSLSIGTLVPAGATIGAALAMLTTDYEDTSQQILSSTTCGAIAGAIVSGVVGAGYNFASTTCFPSEEQKHLNRLARAQNVYENSSVLASTQQYLKRHYTALNNEKIALGICCRRLVTNTTLDYNVRCKLQEKYELLHAQINQLMTTYKNRLDNLYGQQDWLACSKKRYYVPAFLQRSKPSATVRIGVRQVVR